MENFAFRTSPAKQPQLTQAAAELVAIEALTFLAGNPARVDRFLVLSGFERDNLRAAAGEPGFLAAILDYLAPTSHRLRGQHWARPGNDRQGARQIVAPAGDGVTAGQLADFTNRFCDGLKVPSRPVLRSHNS